MPLLTSCGDKESVASASQIPPESRVTAPPRTAIPVGTVPCPTDPTALCLSDKQLGELLQAFDAGEAKRDRMFCWLRVFFNYTACPAE